MKFSAAGGWFSGNWHDRVRAGAQYGFRGVEQLGWLGLDLAEAKRTLEETGVTSTSLIIQSEKEENNRLTAWSHGMVWEDARPAFLESFRESIAVAKALKVPTIIATTGNERADVPREKQFEICVETLRQMADMAEGEGITVVLEPLNVLKDHKGYFLVTSEEAVRMIQAVDRPNLKLLFDIYHQQVSEGNVISNIERYIDWIGHFHVADNPGRNQPGTGELNYTNIFRAIRATGYSGWLAFECGRTVEVPELMAQMHALMDPFAD